MGNKLVRNHPRPSTPDAAWSWAIECEPPPCRCSKVTAADDRFVVLAYEGVGLGYLAARAAPRPSRLTPCLPELASATRMSKARSALFFLLLDSCFFCKADICLFVVSTPDGRAVEHEVDELLEKVVVHVLPFDEHAVQDRAGHSEKHE
jgi:hypothetical protein